MVAQRLRRTVQVADLCQAKDSRSSALVVFYRSNLMAADIEPIAALLGALDREGLAPLAIAVNSLKDPAVEAELGRLIEARKPAVILNTTAFSAGGSSSRSNRTSSRNLLLPASSPGHSHLACAFTASSPGQLAS